MHTQPVVVLTPLPAFSAELWAKIFKYLGTVSLHACSVLCRTMRPHAQRQLFMRIVVSVLHPDDELWTKDWERDDHDGDICPTYGTYSFYPATVTYSVPQTTEWDQEPVSAL